MRTHPWEVDDARWARVQPLLPPPQPSVRGGRSRVDDRRVFAAILYVLWTGCKWMVLLAATLDGLVVARRAPSEEAGQHLSLDRGYDYDTSREEEASLGYEVDIPPPRGQERWQPYAEGSRPRRWVVERTHSWLNRSRRLVRWEKKAENYLALLHLACAQLIFGKLGRLSLGRPEQPI
jgi:transposase